MAEVAIPRQTMRLHQLKATVDNGRTTYLCLANGILEPLIKTKTSKKYGSGILVSFSLKPTEQSRLMDADMQALINNITLAPIEQSRLMDADTQASMKYTTSESVTVSYGLLYGVTSFTKPEAEKLRAEQITVSVPEGLHVERSRNTITIRGLNSIDIHRAAQGARALSAFSHLLEEPDVTNVALATLNKALLVNSLKGKPINSLSSERDYHIALFALGVKEGDTEAAITYIFNGTQPMSVDNEPIRASGIADLRLDR